MRIRNKWLLIPPAAALLLFLGPLQPTRPEAGNPDPVGPPAASVDSPSLPRMPDLMQVGSTLIGVLLLGAAGVFLFARMRNGARGAGDSVFTLRQSMRLGPRQQIWAIEFDQRLLLIGDSAGKLTLLKEGAIPDAQTDERQVLDRTISEEGEEGAVPKDLVIPRPQHLPARRNPVSSRAGRQGPALGDFRSLLQKAGKA